MCGTLLVIVLHHNAYDLYFKGAFPLIHVFLLKCYVCINKEYMHNVTVMANYMYSLSYQLAIIKLWYV